MDEPNGDLAAARSLVVRLWLPDRPGALGQVASRIGSVRGDLLAIDILERGGGQVVDELVVSLPSATSEELLAREIGAVDGVAVEHIRLVGADRPDPAMAMFELAATVAEASDAPVAVLCAGLLQALDAEWAVVVGDGVVVASAGTPPGEAWLQAFFGGSEHLADDQSGPGDVLWARMPSSGLAVAAGRSARAVHERERIRLRVLARIADQVIARTPSTP